MLPSSNNVSQIFPGEFNFISILTIYMVIQALCHSTHTCTCIYIYIFMLQYSTSLKLDLSGWNEIIHIYFCMNYFKVFFPHKFLFLSCSSWEWKQVQKCQNSPSETKSIFQPSLKTANNFLSQEKLSEASFK